MPMYNPDYWKKRVAFHYRGPLPLPEEVDVWSLDQAAIRLMVQRRNTLRKAAHLPLIDEQVAFSEASRSVYHRRWEEFCDRHEADYERIVQEIIVEHGPKARNIEDARWRRTEINRRFDRYVRQAYPTEYAAIPLAPDYLEITRDTVEGDQ